MYLSVEWRGGLCLWLWFGFVYETFLADEFAQVRRMARAASAAMGNGLASGEALQVRRRRRERGLFGNYHRVETVWKMKRKRKRKFEIVYKHGAWGGWQEHGPKTRMASLRLQMGRGAA